MKQLQSGKVFFDESSGGLNYRYKIPEHLCRYQSHNKLMFPLSGFLALFDEVTTWTIVADESSGRRPGVSTALYVELGPAGMKGCGMNAGDEVEINAR